MTRRCELTGKLPMSGNIVSHAENKTRRKFRPNLVNVTLISDALDKQVKVRIAASALKTVEHRGGLDAVPAQGLRRRVVAGLPEAEARNSEEGQGGLRAPGAIGDSQTAPRPR